MQEQGKVKTLSQKSTYNLDHKFAIGLKPIKEEFYRKTVASINYISKLEMSTLTN